MSYWPMSTSHLHLGWLHKVRERRQTLCPLRNMWLAWLDREFGMLQGKHRRMLSLWGTFRHHWVVGTARGPFKIEAKKYKHMKPTHCTSPTWFDGEPSNLLKTRWEIDVIFPFGFYRVRAGQLWRSPQHYPVQARGASQEYIKVWCALSSKHL